MEDCDVEPDKTSTQVTQTVGITRNRGEASNWINSFLRERKPASGLEVTRRPPPTHQASFPRDRY